MSAKSPTLWSEIDAELSGVGEVGGTAPFAGQDDWLRRAPYSAAVDRACAVVTARRHVHRVLVQGRRSQTLDDALRTLGDALELPGYYGQNLDALDECLRELLVLEEGPLGSYLGDRCGREAHGILLTIDHADELLIEAPPGTLDGLLDVLRRSARPEPDPLGRPAPRTASFDVLLFARNHPDGPAVC